MAMQANSELQKFGSEKIKEASDLLSKAFADDPMFRLFFDGPNKISNLQKFFEYILTKSILLDEKLIGITHDSKVVCVANIELPTSIHGIKVLLRSLFILKSIQLMFRIPFRSFQMINQYMKITISTRPKEPHYYLVFLGVQPEFQNKGLGRKVLDHVHEMVDRDPKSVGIGLDTENPDNVKIYKHFGYELISEKKLGDLTIYCMFRTTRRQK